MSGSMDPFVQGLESLIHIENNLERARTTLALKYDFNLPDAFRYFDTYARGYITIRDFEGGLDKLGVSFHPA